MVEAHPTFSILVTAYNREKTLGKCIASIQSQYFFDYEVILVDDGSKDKTLDILKKYALSERRAKLFHQNNRGSGPAFQRAIDESSGRYIVCLDSDDWLAPDALFRLNAFITQGSEPDIVQFEFALECEDGSSVRQCHLSSSFIVETKNDRRLWSIKHHLLSTWRSKAIRRETISSFKVNGMGRGGDNLFIAQAIHCARKIGYLNGCIYYCGVSNDSDSRSPVSSDFWFDYLERWIHTLPWFFQTDCRRGFMIELGCVLDTYIHACLLGPKTIQEKRCLRQARRAIRKNISHIWDPATISRWKMIIWLYAPIIGKIVHGKK